MVDKKPVKKATPRKVTQPKGVNDGINAILEAEAKGAGSGGKAKAKPAQCNAESLIGTWTFQCVKEAGHDGFHGGPPDTHQW